MVAILNAVRDLNRLREIYLVLMRHGFGELAQRLGLGKRAKTLPQKQEAEEDTEVEAEAEEEAARGEEAKKKSSLPQRIRLVAMDLGPSFVKLGQIASTRADVIPKEWIVELKKLQDEVTPLPFADIEKAIEESLGGPIGEIYESFQQEPLAAASVGQVHRAVLVTDVGSEEVVVKVQRPGVRSTVARDVELLHSLAKLIERTVPESNTYSPCGLVAQFDTAITSELDFSLEADNATRFKKNFEDHPEARFPSVHRQASSKSVVTLEFLPGHKVYDAIENHGHHGPVLAKTALRILIKMIFEDGFFHADPHPGNILISGTPDAPVFGFVDLGMVGRLSPEMRDRTVDMMVAAVRQDQSALADALYAIGTPTKKVDMRAFRAEVALLSDKYLGRSLKELRLSAMISDLVGGATKFGLEIPPDFLLVGKALMTIEGVGKELDPDLDVEGVARPLFLELIRRRYSPERIGNDLWRGMERLSTAAYDMPHQMREVLDDLRLGRLKITTVDPSLPGVVDRLGRRLFAGLVVVSFVVSGTWLIAAGKHETMGYVLLGFGVAMMLGHLFLDLARRNGR